MGKRRDRDEALRRLAAMDTPEGAVARRMLNDPPKWKDGDRKERPLEESASARQHAKVFRGFSVMWDIGDFVPGNNMREASDRARAMGEAMAAALGLGKCPKCGTSTFNGDVCGICSIGYGPKQRRNHCWKCTQPLEGEICPTCFTYNGSQ